MNNLNMLESISDCINRIQMYVIDNVSLNHLCTYGNSLRIEVPWEIDPLLSGIQDGSIEGEELSEDHRDMLMEILYGLWRIRMDSSSFINDVYQKIILMLPENTVIDSATLCCDQEVEIVDRDNLDDSINESLVVDVILVNSDDE